MKTIKEITALRVFFMLMIFAHHVNFDYAGGNCAVTAFFLISGFCMTLGYGDKVLRSDFGWKNFMLKRAIKLYPVHWLGLFAMMCVCGNFHIGPKWCINALLLQSWFPSEGIYFGHNSPSWYLCDILFFAAVFPWIIQVGNRLTGKSKLLVLTALLSVYTIVLLVLPYKYWHAYLYVNPISRLLDCVLGVYLAWGYRLLIRDERFVKFCENRVVWLDMLIIFLFGCILAESLLFSGQYILVSALYWPAAVLLLFAIATRGNLAVKTHIDDVLKSKVVQKIGTFSLSFYILHVPCLKMSNFLWSAIDFWPEHWCYAFVGFLITIFFAWLSHELIEKRLINILYLKLSK